MLTPPGPTRRPTITRTIPAATPPLIRVTIPAITRTAAMIHRIVAALPASASRDSMSDHSFLLLRPSSSGVLCVGQSVLHVVHRLGGGDIRSLRRSVKILVG